MPTFWLLLYRLSTLIVHTFGIRVHGSLRSSVPSSIPPSSQNEAQISPNHGLPRFGIGGGIEPKGSKNHFGTYIDPKVGIQYSFSGLVYTMYLHGSLGEGGTSEAYDRCDSAASQVQPAVKPLHRGSKYPIFKDSGPKRH